jgi:hypothetical protein
MDRHRPLLRVAAALALVALLSLPLSAAAAKKKGKQKRSRAVDITMPVNAAIPDGAPGLGPSGLLTSTIQVGGKRFKKQRIRDVNVTLQTTGLSGSVPTDDLIGYLTAPNGATTRLFSNLGLIGTGFSIGPLTLDDESTLALGLGETGNPIALNDPWRGTARPDEPGLYVLDDGPVRGAWVLSVVDTEADETSLLNSWRLVAVTGPPYRTR